MRILNQGAMWFVFAPFSVNLQYTKYKFQKNHKFQITIYNQTRFIVILDLLFVYFLFIGICKLFLVSESLA